MFIAVECVLQKFITRKRRRVYLNAPAGSSTPPSSLNPTLKLPWHNWPHRNACK